MQIELDDFLTWVRSQPPEAEFNFNNPELCAAAQYLLSKGEWETDIFVEYYFVGKKSYNFPPELARVYRGISGETSVIIGRIPITYGNLAARIDAEILSTQQQGT